MITRYTVGGTVIVDGGRKGERGVDWGGFKDVEVVGLNEEAWCVVVYVSYDYPHLGVGWIV